MADSPVFARCDELVLWVLRTTVRFPRPYRSSIGRTTQEAVFRLQRSLIAAARRRDNRSALQQADEALHEARVLLRQCLSLELCTPQQHEHSARLVDEIGTLIGGWRKRQPASA